MTTNPDKALLTRMSDQLDHDTALLTGMLEELEHENARTNALRTALENIRDSPTSYADELRDMAFEALRDAA